MYGFREICTKHSILSTALFSLSAFVFFCESDMLLSQRLHIDAPTDAIEIPVLGKQKKYKNACVSLMESWYK